MSPSMLAQRPLAQGSSELVDVDELVSISMHEMTFVVRPTRQPDALGTQVLVDVVNAATVADSTVLLHRPGGLADPSAAIDQPPSSNDAAGEPHAAQIVGVGFLQLRSEAAVWTIDFGAARFVRSDRPLDRLFLAGADWTGFDAIWIGPQFVSALTVDGSYVAGRRAVQQSCGRVVRDDRRAPRMLRDIA